MTLNLVSWNVNGYRAVWKKGISNWMAETDADIYCIQETKAWPEQLSEEQLSPHSYTGIFAQAERKGYSGVATFCRTAPYRSQVGFDNSEFDKEGRVVITEHQDGRLLVANIYFPNGRRDKERLDYKMRFYEHTLDYFSKLLRDGRNIIVCGDYNTAHREIDLARPRENEGTSGFLPVEREWLDRWIDAGFVDIFRRFDSSPGKYTWWDVISRARERNVGWRIDYHFVSESLVPAVIDASLSTEVMGSDHCPVNLAMDEGKF